MNARTRRRPQRRAGRPRDIGLAMDQWNQAVRIRDEWLAYGLSTDAADRAPAESAIAGLYALIGLSAPRFVWVDSPAAALEYMPTDDGPVVLRADRPVDRHVPWFVTHRLADAVAGLKESLDWRLGSVDDLLDAGVRDALARSIRDGVRAALRLAIPGPVNASSRLCWYGQHDVHWIAHYDVRRTLRPGLFSAEQNRHLDLWATIARSCGWWWSRDGYCVIAERPVAVHTEPAPGAMHGERRPHHPRGPAVACSDGEGGYAWHGTPVPRWVIADPSIERITTEPNIEIRRRAIERIGWDRYIDQAGLALIATAPDPGNPGCRLSLYDLPDRTRVLLAVNGSAERDGERRRYGLPVPSEFNDPISAAGWSYGLTGEQYALLQRRT